eukprot:CAMPEP_0201492716 /NCGR_PEP_ID=MMETSP0151_2-20130828/34459_1 /ASSEMBLY_ACC=CAM_ASM_000257 /TAXON_ID=200890 /ORGANISM="Paramoeba atlantica, Strain 621/1 / CCAP 1560/9" /LENGTH=474 /DNA_ID=CAMNT_0047879699 /DNA_START=37 /DNA_END=1461 /DNA_ORIENTATION=-
MSSETKVANEPGVGGAHDAGGAKQVISDTVLQPELGDVPYEWWEKKTHALGGFLESIPNVKNPIMSAHELRRAIESLHHSTYVAASYYEKWAASFAINLVEKGIVTQAEIDECVGGDEPKKEKGDDEFAFKVGDRVRVKKEDYRTRWRKPHLRIPGYIFGCVGTIERVIGKIEDAQFSAYGNPNVFEPQYRVRFLSSDIWCPVEPISPFSVDVEVYENWLDREEGASPSPSPFPVGSLVKEKECEGGETHIGSDGQMHTHEERTLVEGTALTREKPEAPLKHLAENLCTLLIQKGIIDAKKLHDEASAIDDTGTAPVGKKIVAMAWVDPVFKEKLMKDALATAIEYKLIPSDFTTSRVLTAVEDTPTVHNVIVCTLCSCYPTFVLGMSPAWYKSRAYRARVVLNPKKVLEEFGLKLDDGVEIRVHDSTSDLRYMVIPLRPEGTEGMSVEELEKLVVRDSMIGVSLPLKPSDLSK